jgi:hypothetical protein
MSKLTNWIKGLFGRRRDEEELPAEEFERENGENPYEPGPEQASILARVKRDAEADAIRHAEDMLNRDFPIVTQAEGIAETRLASLRSAYAERRGVLAERIGSLETTVSEMEERLQVTEQALAEEGVQESQIDLPPLRRKRRAVERMMIFLGAIVLLAFFVNLLDLQGDLRLSILGVGLLIIGLVLLFAPGPLLEDPAVVALREQHQAQAKELAELRQQLKGKQDALVELEKRTYAVAEWEVKFAGELASSYHSTVFSSLPVGVLAEDRALKEQRRPRVQMPKWAMELAGAE